LLLEEDSEFDQQEAGGLIRYKDTSIGQSPSDLQQRSSVLRSGQRFHDLDVEIPPKENAPVSIPTSYGFYMSIYTETTPIVHQLRRVRELYPEAPVYIVSDGGANYTGMCESIGNCKFAWRSPGHACWNPKPFLDRFHAAALWMQQRHVEWTVMLEPDVSLHQRASYPVQGDAGGLRDTWNTVLPIKLRNHLQELGRNFSGNQNYHLAWDRFGLAGGSIIRTAAAITAFKPDFINWPYMEELGGERIYSSDIAMPIALAAHGYSWYPWEDVHEGKDASQPKHITAFEHHGKADNPHGKPLYGAALNQEDVHLITRGPDKARENSLGNCQHCIWVEEEQCWPKPGADGFIQCTHDQKNFRKKAWPIEAPRPELFAAVAPPLPPPLPSLLESRIKKSLDDLEGTTAAPADEEATGTTESAGGTSTNGSGTTGAPKSAAAKRGLAASVLPAAVLVALVAGSSWWQ
jgi:hypothetical protein